jgi:serine/threonine-protein kinase
MSDQLQRLTAALADRYAIEQELGAGGMANVYLAEDLKHHRKVAVKVLRPALAAVIGAERFLHEIEVTAHLQHPHILPLFDSGEADGFLYYVMPHVEGESLRDRLRRETQLGLEEAVAITKAVASALDYAHRHDVIHRDIKPENILLQDGQPVVADFGIALAVTAAGGTRLTETGLSLGTPHYMSPEQATADREIDGRTDTYSLGCVAYEMLVGEPPFTAPTAQAVVAKILAEDPALVTVRRRTVPPNVEAAIHQALAKLPADRFTTAAQLADALANPGFALAGTATTHLIPTEVPSTWQQRLAIPMTVAAVVMTVLFLWASGRPRSDPGPLRRYPIALPADQALRPRFGSRIAVSPDGARIVYIGSGEGGGAQLWLREWHRLQATPLAGTEDPRTPFFSPDGENVAFFSSDEALVIAALDGAPPVVVADSGIRSEGGWWGRDGYLYVDSPGGLARVPEGGGAPAEPVTKIAEGETSHNWPTGLPNGKGLLFIIRHGGDVSQSEVAVVDFETGGHRTLTRGVHVRYARTGHLIYATADGTLMAAPFDQGRMEMTGPATALTEVVGLGQYGTADLDLSDNGTLVYVAGGGGTGGSSELVWVSSDGTAEPVVADWRGQFHTVALSPDGLRLAVSMVTQEQEHIYVRGLDGGVPSTLTFTGSRNWRPEWTPDGRGITFVSDRSGKLNLYLKPADGTGLAVPLLDRELGVEEAEWSSDGEWLVFREGGGLSGHQRDILAVRPGKDEDPVALATTESEEKVPTLSPDGRWLAYESTESGRAEVWVRPFPGPSEAKWKVSLNGGVEPLWAHNGRELFYRNRNNELVVATVQTTPTFALVSEQALFPAGAYRLENNHRAYDVAADDQRFLMIRLGGTGGSGELVLVENWFEDLKARVGS